MNQYTCNGFRSVKAETMTEAAKIFASQAARRKYGRAGYCRTCVMESCAENGSMAEFSAFTGRTTGLDETTGHNIHLVVFTA